MSVDLDADTKPQAFGHNFHLRLTSCSVKRAWKLQNFVIWTDWLTTFLCSIHLLKEMKKANCEDAEMTTLGRKLNSPPSAIRHILRICLTHSVGLLLGGCRDIDPVRGAYSSGGRRAKRRKRPLTQLPDNWITLPAVRFSNLDSLFIFTCSQLH
jgi:hypothetical protein